MSEKRFDWYQTESDVIISIMQKGIQKESVKVECTSKTLSVEIQLPSNSFFTLDLNLAHEVNGDDMVYKVLKTKMEIKLPKRTAERWNKLEADDKDIEEETVTKSYPTSTPQKKDWNKIEKDVIEEEKNEKLEGDAALNKLFQDIYANATPETRMAMNKSYQESCGTVLSTNWDEINKKNVDVKAPDGMEYKKWDG